jgi:hypothetical protein
VLRSQIHTLPSVAPVTTVFVLVDEPTGAALVPSTAATMLTKAMASTLSPSAWPPSAEMTSPLLRLMTRTPPSAPPTTAILEAGLTASDVMPPKSNRASSPVSLKSGVGERGSQYIKVLSAHAVTIRLPRVVVLARWSTFEYNSFLTVGCEVPALDRPRVAGKDLHNITRWHCGATFESLYLAMGVTHAYAAIARLYCH